MLDGRRGEADYQDLCCEGGLTEKVSGHSLRIGTTVSLAQRGASLVDIQVAGRWKDPGMPAHYARAQFAENGAIARFKDRKR